MLLVPGLVVASVGFAAANPANAETGIWHQSFERASQDAECQPPSDETPWQASFSGQREWTPSWAQWPNDGTGGWVCQRQIIWADVASYPSAGCILALDLGFPFGDAYADFGGGFTWPANSLFYTDSSCQSVSGVSYLVPMVYAPAGFDPNALCRQAFGMSVDPTSSGTVADTYFCQ